MNTVLFIVFIMMIIIFLNELKNISFSFFRINYIKDVSDINIKKYCNDIYCEAETARFKLADNSYNLISSNDIFNTRTYYLMILIIIVLIYVNILYNLFEYNNNYCSGIDNTDGDIIIIMIKAIPYILAIIVFIFSIILIIARYIPDDKEGYINYFNYNNLYIKSINNFNIETISIAILSTIIALGSIYILLSLSAKILEYPEEEHKSAVKYKFLSLGYFIIVAMFSYLILNFINILFSFSYNKYPKLDDDILNAIANNLDTKISYLTDIYIVKNIVEEFYEKYDKDTKVPQLTVNKLVMIDDKYRYIINVSETRDKEVKFLLNGEKSDEIIDDKFKKDFKVNTIFPLNKSEYDIYFNMIAKDKLPPNYNAINIKPDNILNNITLSNLTFGQTYDKLNVFIDRLEEKKLDINKKYQQNTLLKVLICFSLNELNSFKKTISEQIIAKQKDDAIKYNYYIKHAKLLELIDYIIKCINSKDIEFNEGADKIKSDIIEYSSIDIGTSNNVRNIGLFGVYNNPFSTPAESLQNYSVDFSYNSENTFYEQYFNFLENLNKPSYFDLEYKIGSYYIRNIKTLAYFIMMIFGISILYLVLFYIQNNDIVYKYFDEIILPIIILSIFVLFIIVFINFNTNYNLNFVYGALNSSYKRDLNDLNNMIIPIISKSYSRDNYIDGPYNDIYLITNVLMSFIYHNDGYLENSSLELGNFNIVIDNTVNKRENFQDIDYDYVNFKDYHDKVGKLIYNKLYYDTDAVKYYDASNNLVTDMSSSPKPYDNTRLYSYINSFIPEGNLRNVEYITRNLDNFKEYINKFIGNDANAKIKNYLINIIKNLIKSFKTSDKSKPNNNVSNFLERYAIFYNSKEDDKKVWNKFLLKKKFFDDYKIYENYNESLNTYNENLKKTPTASLAQPVPPTNIDYQMFKQIFGNTNYIDNSYIDEHVNEYMKILSHYYFNNLILNYQTPAQPSALPENILFKPITTATIYNEIKEGVDIDVTNTKYNSVDKFIYNYRNNKLFRLLLLQKQKSENKNLNMDDTFYIRKDHIKIETVKSATNTVTVSGVPELQFKLISMNDDVFNDATQIYSIYYKMIDSGIVNLDMSDNYLMNLIKSIYYQINDKRIEYHIPADDKYIGKDCTEYGIINKKPFAMENIINENANYTITYELFTTYFINLVMIGIIYNIALIKNNNINKLF